jgi:hypothetical protein
MKQQPKWKRFEDLVASIQKSLSRRALVLQDQTLEGNLGFFHLALIRRIQPVPS